MFALLIVHSLTILLPGNMPRPGLASSKTPLQTDSWERHGSVFPGNHKSGALLIRDQPPHYLISGAGQIHIAKSDNLLDWTLGPLFINSTLWGNPHVEAGPPPMLLDDGTRMNMSCRAMSSARRVALHLCCKMHIPAASWRGKEADLFGDAT